MRLHRLLDRPAASEEPQKAPGRGPRILLPLSINKILIQRLSLPLVDPLWLRRDDRERPPLRRGPGVVRLVLDRQEVLRPCPLWDANRRG